MNQEQTLAAVLHSDELPTLPTVASEIITLTAREDTTLTDIGDLVSKDTALSAKILKVSNSAFYSFPQQISSINQAVSILGINAVRSLVLSFSFLSIKAGKKRGHFNFETFWKHSLAGAVASKLILGQVKGADTEEVFVCGLLQNLGELILARTFAEEYEEVLKKVEDGQYDHLNAEEEVFGTFHSTIGYEVAKNWGFPEVLLLPILYHHEPTLYKGGNPKIDATTKALYLSDLLINILYSNKPEEFHKRFNKEAKTLLGLKNKDLEYILNEVHTQVDQAGEYFGLRIKNTKSIQEILQEANIRLSLMNLDFDQMNQELIRAKVKLENLTKELEAKNKILANLANMDGLTEIYNHRYFQITLENEIDRCIRNASQLSLLLIDIDHFKNFNDTYGHQVGDFILKEFSRILKENIRKYDTLARYGGEEFTVILPDTNAEEASAVAEKLREAIDNTTFSDSRDEYHITASFGVSSARPATIDNFEKSNFISQADAALYEAKEGGRNQVVTYAAKKRWYKF
ncbi:MAG: GGDEF domain-containing protein [Proteobacteria bacterium]|nr:GGDEF domain-containing protein [Pseudomonadota bacterium]MBU1231321.1 GGDEF domain-containing protein [Pseudomonadota bacterium]MBU1420365.1 GGDEF domain-containing protein [Pseudomonadota bacterium]MBU1454375.1 GGDEF domain-containing protein [Pseudomonadota bacterium]